MPTATTDSLYVAGSVPDAIAALRDRGPAATIMAGATWTMRAPIRRDTQVRAYVAIGEIAELCAIEIGPTEIKIGSCITHAGLASRLRGIPELQGLVAAASGSANPAIREMATIGGNLCATDFAAADLVPALLCLDADIEIEAPGGSTRMAIAEFLARRSSLGPASLVRRIIIPRRSARSAHARLPLRKAGDYPVAIVSMSIETQANGLVVAARIAVGSVEAVARRWPELEAALIGRPLNAGAVFDLATDLAHTFVGRDSIEAPGWYRVKVLPTLVRRAVETLQALKGDRECPSASM